MSDNARHENPSGYVAGLALLAGCGASGGHAALSRARLPQRMNSICLVARVAAAKVSMVGSDPHVRAGDGGWDEYVVPTFAYLPPFAQGAAHLGHVAQIDRRVLSRLRGLAADGGSSRALDAQTATLEHLFSLAGRLQVLLPSSANTATSETTLMNQIDKATAAAGTASAQLNATQCEHN